MLVVVAVALLGAAGCGTTQSAPAADAGVDAATQFTEEAMRSALIAFRTKYCAAKQKCDPVKLALDHGTVAACIGDATRPIADVIVRYGYGSTRTPEGVRACADALDFSSCEDFVRYEYERLGPAACRSIRYGTLEDGSACGDDDQCVSGRCLHASGVRGRVSSTQPRESPAPAHRSP